MTLRNNLISVRAVEKRLGCTVTLILVENEVCRNIEFRMGNSVEVSACL